MKAIQNIWRKKEMAVIEVVAAVIYKENKFMIAQRNLKKSQGGLWEFPGGKIEPGETREEALKREIYEEFHAEIKVRRIGDGSRASLSGERCKVVLL